LATTIAYFVVLEGETAWQKGIRGEMIVLEYCDWEFGNTCFEVLTKTIPDNREKNKKLVALNATRQIVQYDFDKGPMGLQLLPVLITGKDFYDIEKQYNEWKQGK
jgi:hypothetical protein